MIRDDKKDVECLSVEKVSDDADPTWQGAEDARIYEYLFLFLLDSFTYLPFIDVSSNLWADQFLPSLCKSRAEPADGKLRVEKQQQ